MQVFTQKGPAKTLQETQVEIVEVQNGFQYRLFTHLVPRVLGLPPKGVLRTSPELPSWPGLWMLKGGPDIHPIWSRLNIHPISELGIVGLSSMDIMIWPNGIIFHQPRFP